MGRINQYPECTTPDNSDLLLIETTEGTKKIKKQTLLKAVMDLLGDDDISEIADGTVTGVINDLDDEVSALTDDINKLKAEINDIVNVYGAKNLIPYPYNVDSFPKTTNGVTFTNGGNGIIIANRTTGSSNGNFGVYKGTLKKGTYILTGVTSHYSSNKVRCALALNNWSTLYVDYGDGVKFTITDETIEYIIYVGVIGNNTVTNEIFKPMLRLASIQDDTWVPYAKTNKQLT